MHGRQGTKVEKVRVPITEQPRRIEIDCPGFQGSRVRLRQLKDSETEVLHRLRIGIHINTRRMIPSAISVNEEIRVNSQTLTVPPMWSSVRLVHC